MWQFSFKCFTSEEPASEQQNSVVALTKHENQELQSLSINQGNYNT